MIGTIPRGSAIIGFLTHQGRYVCRDTWCVKLIAGKNDVIERIVKANGFDPPHCDFCQARLHH